MAAASTPPPAAPAPSPPSASVSASSASATASQARAPPGSKRGAEFFATAKADLDNFGLKQFGGRLHKKQRVPPPVEEPSKGCEADEAEEVAAAAAEAAAAAAPKAKAGRSKTPARRPRESMPDGSPRASPSPTPSARQSGRVDISPAPDSAVWQTIRPQAILTGTEAVEKRLNGSYPNFDS